MSTPSPPARPRAAATLAALLALLLGLASCQPPTGTSDEPEPEPDTPAALVGAGPGAEIRFAGLPRVDQIDRQPTLRVRIEQHAQQLQLDAPQALQITAHPVGGQPRGGRTFDAPVTVQVHQGRFQLRDANGRTFAWRSAALSFRCASGQPVRVGGSGGNAYPGRIELIALARGDGSSAGVVDAINHVGMEDYLPGVLERELFPNWDAEAFAAQAIAARSYALFERQVNAQRHYDLQATTASQVYGGVSDHAVARAATQRTRGMVLVENGRVVPGFYSSTCGGRSQDATLAFPHWRGELELNALSGHTHCQTCTEATYYRWGPFARDRQTLARRIAAWGQANEHPVGGLHGLDEITIASRSSSGRPATFQLIDQRGRAFAMAGEHFRFACNFAGEGLPAVQADQQLRSSDLRVRVAGSQVQFANGRGFGHGAGMCQWGAQGLAQRGDQARQIVEHYYRGASVQRAY